MKSEIQMVSTRVLFVCLALIASGTAAAEEGVRTSTKLPSYVNNSDYKVGVGFDRGFSVVAQLYNRVNLSLGDDGIAADYLFLDGKFSPSVPFTWYIGAGAFYDWDDECHNGCGVYYDGNGKKHRDSDHYFNDYGIRVPFGVDWNFASRWDTYAQVAPVINIPDDFDVDFQAAIGIRYSF